LRRLAGVNEPPVRRRLGACCRNPERFLAKDLNANSVQRINATSGAKARSEGNLYGTAKAVPFHNQAILTAWLKPCPCTNPFAETPWR
jgi:hypothetical protein